MAVLAQCPTPGSRRWRLVPRVIVLIVTSVLSLSSMPGTARSAVDAPQRPLGFPYVMRPGDVLVNAPIGVRRTPHVVAMPRLLVSVPLGVRRISAPEPSIPVSLVSPALGIIRGSGIRRIEPDVLSVGASAQSVSIFGHGLGGASNVVVEPSADITIASFAVAPGGERIDLVVDVGPGAVAGLRRLRVAGQGGAQIAEAVPGAGRLLIADAAPRIDSVAPNMALVGTTLMLEIRGANLRGVPWGVRGELDAQPTVSITPSDAIVIGSAPMSNEAGTLVTVPISIGMGALPGHRLVQIETGSGMSTGTSSPANTLELVTTPLRILAPFVSVPVGVRRSQVQSTGRFLSSPTLGVSRGAVVTSLVPTSASPGDSLRLRLGGRGLSTATDIVVVPSDGITIDTATLVAIDTEIAVDIRISADAPLLPRRVVARGPTWTVSTPDLLAIRGAAPEVAAVTPGFLVRDGTSQAFELQGTHFSQATQARLVPDTDLVFESFIAIDDTRARLVMRAATSAVIGSRVVIVSGPSGASPTIPSSANTVHVVDRAQVLTPIVSPPLGVRRGAAGPAEFPFFLHSATVGVARGAVATAVAPPRVARGTTTRVTVHGQYLSPTDAVSIAAIDGITLHSLAAAPDGTSVAFDIDVAVDAAIGPRRLELLAEGMPIPFAPASARLLSIDDNVVVGPIAVPDTYAAITNHPLSIPAAEGVLANDHDPNGGILYAVLRRLPSFGTLRLSPDGSFVYSPNQDFIGSDRFEYSAGSGALVGASTTVMLNVAQIHDAVDDHYATNDNQILDVSAALGLLANDVITPGATVAIELASEPTLGQLTLAVDGGFRYVPHGAAGTDRFRYRLVADGIRSAAADVTIVVNDLNERPVAVDDQYAVDVGRTLTVTAPGVLRNDTDPDGDTLSARAVSDPPVGNLALGAAGGFTYTPPAGFTGQVSFVYEVSDPRGLRAQATVVIQVNDHLAPAPDAYSVDEGEVLFVDAPGVLANDSIIAQGTLRIVVVDQPTFGTLQMANDGSFVYRPATPDINGVDTFRYRLEDGVTVSYPVAVRLTISGVNDPPRTADDHFLTDENVELSVPAAGVLANDSDIDSASLSARIIDHPVHGTVVLRANGSFSYVPETNFRGVDTFIYEAFDADGAASLGSVRVDVTQPPTATNDVYLVDIDTPLVISDQRQGLLINDHDAPENDDLMAVMGAVPSHGVVALEPNGTFTYIPDPGYQGIDTFTYQVSDGRSLSNFGNVTLAVGITNLPRANPDAYSIEEDGELVVAALDGVLANDTDADTPHALLEAYIVGYDYWNTQSVTLEDDGSLRFRPNANFTGETYFVYKVYDGTSESNAAMVRITVEPVNDGVIAEDDFYGVRRNTIFEPRARPIRFNDRYDSDYSVNFEVVVPSQHGVVELDAVSGLLRYTPPRDFAGVDTFTYRVFQVDTGIGDTAVVTLRTNGAPVANPDTYTVPEDSISYVSPNPLANDTDPDGDVVRMDRLGFHDGRSYGHVEVDRLEQPTITKVTTSRHFYGTLPIRYVIEDGTEQSESTITLVVTPVPEAPIVHDDSYVTPRNTALFATTASLSVLHNDFDPDTRPWAGGTVWEAASGLDLLPPTAELVSGPTHGSLSFGPVGTFTYTPVADFSGSDTFVYRAVDATGRASAPATARIRVNTPPASTDDAYVVTEDVPLVEPASTGVLANDNDIDGDSLEAVIAIPGSGCAPCNGRVQIRSDGGFTYTPNANFFGQDEFSYQVRDGVAGSSNGRVVLTVLPVNDAPYTEPDSYRTREDEVLIAPEPQGILRNDREVDGERLVDAQLIEAPTRGAVAVSVDGSFAYTPNADVNGRDTFRYRVFDESGLSTDENVEVLITPVNDAPVARDDSYAIDQDEVLSVDAAHGVLVNDNDVDGPRLTASLVGPPQHGQLDLQADGSFVYEPDGIFSGVDHFQYQVDDGLGAVAVAVAAVVVRPVDATVTITVEDDLFGFEGPTVTIAAPGVLANDRVEGATTLAATLIVPPDVGSVELRADGGFSYQAPAGFAGLVGFTYAASASGVSELARVILDVRTTANVPPVAVGEHFGVLEDRILDSRSSGSLLANDSDFENAPLSLVVEQAPQYGAFSAHADGHFTYVPAPDYNGPDRVVYRVSDGQRVSEPATASITVFAQNDPPKAMPDLYRMTGGVVLDVPSKRGLLSNDSDVDGDDLDVELVDAPEHGQVRVATDGGFNYQPAPGHTGSDRFRYAATDGIARDVAEVTITVAAGLNHPPIATGESYVVDEDSILESATSGSLLANDIDPDGDPLHVIIVEGPASGILESSGAGFTYRPAANYFGQDAFRYRVSDGDLASEVVTATIHIRAINDAPVAVTDRYVVVQDAALVVAATEGVLANDADVESQPLVASVVSGPAHGTLLLHADGAFAYHANAGFNGRDEFAYRVSDGKATAMGRAAIDVTPLANQRPVAVGEVFAIAEDSVLDTRVLESLLANDHDPEGAPLTLVMPDPPATGVLERLPGGHVRYVPARDEVGDVVIAYAVSDGVLESAPVEVRITLLPVPDPPEAQSDLYVLAAGASALMISVESGVLANDRDADGDTLIAELVLPPAHGTLQLALDGSFTYRRRETGPQTDGFRYRARDPAGHAAEAEVVVDLGGGTAIDPIFRNGFETP